MSNDFQTQFQNHMTLQRFSHHTMKNYMAAVKGLADYYGKSPDLIEDDEIEDTFAFSSMATNWLGRLATTILPEFPVFIRMF